MFPDPVPMGRSQDGNLSRYYHVSNKQVEKQHCQEVKKQKCQKVFFSFKTFHFNNFLDCHSWPKLFSSQTLIIFLILILSQLPKISCKKVPYKHCRQIQVDITIFTITTNNNIILTTNISSG